MPWMRGERPDWRRHVISEYEYSLTPIPAKLRLAPCDARLFLIFDGRFKMIHAEGGFRPMLFDLAEDPEEFADLGRDGACAAGIVRLYGHLAEWGRRMALRVTVSDADLRARQGRSLRRGILPCRADKSVSRSRTPGPCAARDGRTLAATAQDALPRPSIRGGGAFCPLRISAATPMAPISSSNATGCSDKASGSPSRMPHGTGPKSRRLAAA